jgi:type II restriction enzyme
LSSGLHSALKVEHKGRSFRLSEGDRLLKLLKKESTSASSGSSNDIFLKINHSRVNLPDSLVGFSIKSQLGSAATFLNASLATNFVYEIVPVAALPKRSIPKFSENIKESIQNLIACGYSLKFTNLDNDIFKRNLELIDKNLPQQLAKCLAETMNHSKNHVSQIVETVFPLNSKENEVIQSNIKLFLSHVLQGMRPAREWSKLSSTSGGIIHVKSSGEVLIHVSDQLDDLRNYLFNKLKFERGDRGRHKYGTPFKVGNKTFIKLNLQLRFI